MQKNNNSVVVYTPGGVYEGGHFVPYAPSNDDIEVPNASESLYIDYREYEEDDEVECYDICHKIFTTLAFIAIGATVIFGATDIIGQYQDFD